jgi:hypothetical protein
MNIWMQAIFAVYLGGIAWFLYEIKVARPMEED